MADPGTTRSGRARRRTSVRRDRAQSVAAVARALGSPFFGWGLLVSVAFVVVCGILANWARERPLIAVGRVMSETWTVRVEFTTEDPDATEAARQSARQAAPRVYVAEDAALDEVRTSLTNLPRTVSGVASTADIAPDLQKQFRLDESSLAALQEHVSDGAPGERWLSWVEALLREIERRPFLDEQTWQHEDQAANKFTELRVNDRSHRIPASDAVNTGNPEELARAVQRLTRDAGFPGPLSLVVQSRLLSNTRPTFRFDPAQTQQRQNDAAASVAPITRTRPKGEIIFTRGDVLTPAKFELYKAEREHFRATETWRVWLRRGSVIGAVAAITLAAAGYAMLFCPRIRQNPARMAALAALMAGAVAASCLGSVAAPGLIMLTAIAPTVFMAVILVVAYDQRVALALGSLHGVLTCIALDQPIGMYALMVTGVGMAVWRLKEVRDRDTLVRMGVMTSLALAFGTVIVALIDRPISPAAIRQLWVDAAWAGSCGIVVAGVTMFVLPLIEKTFGITTGMTLVELRDPKNALLRLLQQKAPGTYNHSLNVAALAEAAADSIGADALLTYVGALYHDIGKMNKPEYFVENLSGGPSKHEKLSPAMSLLVIVGHVKDGMELAEEFNLPKVVRHFIEAHHGTTLVEFFYQRARQQAEAQGAEHTEPPEEIEYRYPGPKPQTKGAAIVMLADAVESTTRTMAEPTPSRIDSLVRAIANARLMDGQFDECDLTLRELSAIVESISKTLAATYHGRVQYPSTAGFSSPQEKRA